MNLPDPATPPGGIPPKVWALFKEQLLIVLVNRLGGEVAIPVAEVDATGAWTMTFEIDQQNRVFHLTTGRKQ